MAIFVILAIMAKLDMAINMAVMGVFLKRSQNADQTWKPFVNWSKGLKVMAKTKENTAVRLLIIQYLKI